MFDVFFCNFRSTVKLAIILSLFEHMPAFLLYNQGHVILLPTHVPVYLSIFSISIPSTEIVVSYYFHILLFTSDNGGGIRFHSHARVRLSVCLSVCLCARLLKNACMDLDEMLRVDRRRHMDELINF